MNPSLLLNPRNRFKKQKLEKQAQRIAEHKAGLKGVMDFFDQLEELDPDWASGLNQDGTAQAVIYRYGQDNNRSDQDHRDPMFDINPSTEDDAGPHSDESQDSDWHSANGDIHDPLGAELSATSQTQDQAGPSSLHVGSYPVTDTGKSLTEVNTSYPPKSPSKSATPRFDPLVLLSPSKRQRQQADALAAEDSSRAEDHNDASVSSISMLERMHNVRDRDASDFHKRKVENSNDDESRKKAKFNGMTGGGMLTESLRAEAQKQALKNGPPALSASNTVDLTADDDDDEVIYVNPDLEQEVCLGQWVDIRVNANLVPISKSKSFQGSSTMWPQMHFTLERGDSNTLIVRCKDTAFRNFGNIDAASAAALAPLLDGAKLNRLRTNQYLKPRRKEPGLGPGDPCSESLDVILLLFAPRKKVLALGNYLRNKGISLKDPITALVPKGCDVVNPFKPKPKTVEEEETVKGSSAVVRAAGSKAPAYTRTVEEQRGDIQDLFDSLTKTEDLPEMEQPSNIKTPLLSHQKQALTFLTQRERETGWKDEEDESGFSLWRNRHHGNGNISYYNVITGHELRARPAPVLGGILADMMGLGKTLSILSLIASTSHQALEFSTLNPPRTPDRMLKCNVKGTLLVVPVSTIQNWEEQIHTHVAKGKLKVYVHHGAKRVPNFAELKKFDVVITGYQSLAAEIKRGNSSRPLYDVQWFRIVLDEAHMIRNQTTRLFQGCYEIAATRRWAVTGTPVQNRLEDLGAIFRFLRIKPFDQSTIFSQYFIQGFKIADPDVIPKLRLLVDSVTLRRMKDRIDLPGRNEHTVYLDFSDKENKLYQFFLQDSGKKVRAITQDGLKGRAYAHILKAILRLRQISAHGQELLNEEDLKMAEGFHKDSAIEIGDNESEEEDEEKPALTEKQAFEMFFLLRESDFDRCEACHIKIGLDSAAVVEEEEDPEDGIKGVDTVGFMTPCFHILCPKHIDAYRTKMVQNQTDPLHYDCATCKINVRNSLFELKQSELDDYEDARARIRRDGKLHKHLGRYTGPHTKTSALIARLHEFKEQSLANPEEAPIKTVVFSGWTSHLDLIQIALENNNFKFVRLDGSMARKARSAAIDTFRDDPSIPVILATVGAAGLGLNLTAANKVFVMEPQFNPAAEAQAVDRVHRLGQRREVEIVRFIMRGSCEEGMLDMQAKKKDLADLSLDRGSHLTKAEQSKKRLEELRALFK